MKANLDKCHLLLSTTEAFNPQISETLKFEKHLTTNCQKANRKLNALARVTPDMDLQKRQILMYAFVKSV